MRALLLAAGIGTRLRPITNSVPKCLVPIHERPLLSYWLDLLFDGGIERVLINTHHLAEAVRSFVASSPWRDRVDLVHDDNLTNFDVRALSTAHASRPPGVAMTMLAFRTDDPKSCGILEMDSGG